MKMTREEYDEAIVDVSEKIYMDMLYSGKLDGFDVGIVTRAFAHLGATLLRLYEQDEGASVGVAECREHCAAMFLEQVTHH